MKNLTIPFFLILSLFSTNCDKGSDGLNLPSKLTITTEISTDGSGKVDIAAKAENSKYFKFYFGDVDNEIPIQSTFGSFSHTYKETGTYTVTVQAHADETLFISETKTFDVAIFFQIPTTGYSTPASYPGMNLVWSDEFETDTVDPDKWAFENGDGCPDVCGWGNNELEYYQEANALLQEGKLIIVAKAEPAGGKSYTSSKLTTKNKLDFKYGRVDVRAALPQGQGMWPAIWMLGSNITTVGWPACGEIDIMEMIGGGGRENKVYGTAHWDNGGAYANYGGNYTLSSGIFKTEFHVFSITWDADYIRWFVDDNKFHEILISPSGLSEFKESFYLILNVAVGGNWPGNPDGTTVFPQRMVVDYVRVFQKQ